MIFHYFKLKFAAVKYAIIHSIFEATNLEKLIYIYISLRAKFRNSEVTVAQKKMIVTICK